MEINRYIISFSKDGYIKYTSHLDMVRLFERVFKRGDIRLAYSQGFNPHPKLIFAQPLSLGYTSESEQIEIETKVFYEAEELRKTMNDLMPEGIEVFKVEALEPPKLNEGSRTIASKVVGAEFSIEIPLSEDFYGDFGEIVINFLAQDTIKAWKKQKKKKDLKEIDIKPMIHELEAFEKMAKNVETGKIESKLILKARVDQGSASNLSPELIIPAFLEFTGIKCHRSEIEICRNTLIYE